MSERVKQKQDARRRELLEIALSLFMEVGYEKSSIRLLASRAGGDIGLIYHYFGSKTEIYRAALTYYNEKYLKKIAGLVDDPTLNFDEKLDILFTSVDASLAEYRPMKAKGNEDIMLILHAQTLNCLAPIFDKLILAYLTERKIVLDKSSRQMTSNYMLFGASGIIHAQGEQSMSQRNEAAKQLLYKTLEHLSAASTAK